MKFNLGYVMQKLASDTNLYETSINMVEFTEKQLPRSVINTEYKENHFRSFM